MIKKILIGLFLGIIAFLVIGYYVLDKPLPEGTSGAEAEELANNMLKAINNDAWLKTGAVSWTFLGIHDFVWDKERHYVLVSWDENQVWLDINKKRGEVLVDGKSVDKEEADELLVTAWEFWANDSFWLNPISKIKDPGTSRSLVKTEDGEQALLVKYNAGGVTPGDSYLWIVGDDYLPTSCQMWVSIFPIGGVEFEWLNWEEQSTGFKTALDHKGAVDIPISNIKTSKTLLELKGEDIFSEL